MADSGVVVGGQIGEGNLKFPAVDEVAATDAARRARERVELVDLLNRFAGATPDLCCNNLDLQPGTDQIGACDCDRPGAKECLGDCAAQGTDPQSDSFDGGISVGGGLFDGVDHRPEQSKFMHPPMMAGPSEAMR